MILDADPGSFQTKLHLDNFALHGAFASSLSVSTEIHRTIPSTSLREIQCRTGIVSSELTAKVAMIRERCFSVNSEFDRKFENSTRRYLSACTRKRQPTKL